MFVLNTDADKIALSTTAWVLSWCNFGCMSVLASSAHNSADPRMGQSHVTVSCDRKGCPWGLWHATQCSQELANPSWVVWSRDV